MGSAISVSSVVYELHLFILEVTRTPSQSKSRSPSWNLGTVDSRTPANFEPCCWLLNNTSVNITEELSLNITKTELYVYLIVDHLGQFLKHCYVGTISFKVLLRDLKEELSYDKLLMV